MNVIEYPVSIIPVKYGIYNFRVRTDVSNFDKQILLYIKLSEIKN